MCVHTHTPSLPSLTQGEMLSTENAPVSTSLLPALSKWILQNSTVTVDQLTLTANCIDSTPETTCKSAVVTLRPINPVVYENEGSVTFNISATREVSIEFQTIRGSAGVNYICSYSNYCRGAPLYGFSHTINDVTVLHHCPRASYITSRFIPLRNYCRFELHL